VEPQSITSARNPRVKALLALRERRDRDREQRFLIEGYRPVRRALDNHYPLLELYICPALFLGQNEPALVAAAAAAGAAIFEVSPEIFARLTYRARPEGLLATAPQRHPGLDDLALTDHSLLIVAEAIEKPGNLGTMLRSADAAGAQALVVCDACTDIFNPNVVCASIGTLFSVPLVEASSTDVLAWCRRERVAVIAATPHATAVYTDVDLTGRVAIVMGTEQYGLTEPWLKHADAPVRIPMYGQADSLNVATATTLLLFEAVRQRRAKGLLP
jgi:RNA methyltransferase, TrmH family